MYCLSLQAMERCIVFSNGDRNLVAIGLDTEKIRHLSEVRAQSEDLVKILRDKANLNMKALFAIDPADLQKPHPHNPQIYKQFYELLVSSNLCEYKPVIVENEWIILDDLGAYCKEVHKRITGEAVGCNHIHRSIERPANFDHAEQYRSVTVGDLFKKIEESNRRDMTIINDASMPLTERNKMIQMCRTAFEKLQKACRLVFASAREDELLQSVLKNCISQLSKADEQRLKALYLMAFMLDTSGLALREFLFTINHAKEKNTLLFLEKNGKLEMALQSGCYYAPAKDFFEYCWNPQCNGKHCVKGDIALYNKRLFGVIRSLSQKCCLSCGKSSKELKRCGRCKAAFYCTADCQTKDWSEHQKTCFASSF